MSWFWASRDDLEALQSSQKQLSELQEKASFAVEQHQGTRAVLTDLADRLSRNERSVVENGERLDQIRSELIAMHLEAAEAPPPVAAAADSFAELATRLDRIERQTESDVAEARQIGVALAERIELVRRMQLDQPASAGRP